MPNNHLTWTAHSSGWLLQIASMGGVLLFSPQYFGSLGGVLDVAAGCPELGM